MEELRMYILLNSDIKMSKGKAIAQASHGVSEVTEIMLLNHKDRWRQYSRCSHPKITLKCPQEIMHVLRKKYSRKLVDVIDEGRTQLEPGTLTSLVFLPMTKSEIPVELSNLKLY